MRFYRQATPNGVGLVPLLRFPDHYDEHLTEFLFQIPLLDFYTAKNTRSKLPYRKGHLTDL